MKNHTTPSTVLISIILLIVSIAALVIFVDTYDFHPEVAGRLLKMIPQGDNFTISIESINPSLFQKIVLNKVKLHDKEGRELLSLEEITLDIPLYALFIERFAPKTLYVEGHGAVANFNLDLFKGGEGEIALPTIKMFLKLYFDEIRVEEDSFNLALGEGLLSVDLREGELGSIELIGNSLALSSPEIEFISEVVQGRFVNSEQAVLAITDSYLLLNTLDTIASIDQAELYLRGNPLEGSGALSGRGQGGFVKLSQGKVGFDSLSLAATLDKFTFSDGEISLKDLWGAYDQFGANIALFNGIYNSGFEANLFSPETLFVTYRGSQLAQLESPMVLLSEDGELGSLLVNVETLSLYESELLNQVGLDRVEILTPHFLVIENHTENRLNAESSFFLSGESSNPLLGSFEGKFAAALELLDRNEVSFGELAFSELTATNLHGEVDGFFHYDGTLSGNVNHSAQIGGQLEYDLNSNLMRFSLLFNETSLGEFEEPLHKLSPVITQFLDNETHLSGNIIGQANLSTGGGRATSELAFTNVIVAEGRHSFATTFNGRLDEDFLYIDLATLATEAVRLSYGGTFNLQHLFPEGNLTLSNTETGETIIGANFRRLEEHLYGYDLNLFTLAEIELEGEVSWDDEGLLKSSAHLNFPLISYPLTLTGNLDESSLFLESDGLTLSLFSGEEVGHLRFSFEADSFPLPPLKDGFARGQGRLSGSLNADYGLANNVLLIEGENLELKNIAWQDANSWTLQSELEADNNQIRLKNLTYFDDYGSYKGELSLSNSPLFDKEFENFAFDLSLAGEGEERINLTLFSNPEGETLLLYGEIEEFPLTHFNLFDKAVIVNTTLLGETNFDDLVLGYLNFNFKEEGGSFEGAIEGRLEGEELVLERGLFKTKSIRLEIPRAHFPFGDTAQIELDFLAISEIAWRDANTRSVLSLNFTLPPQENFTRWVKELPKVATKVSPVTISHRDTSLMGEIEWPDGSHLFTFDDRVIRVKPLVGGTLEGSYSLVDNSIVFSAVEGFPIPIDLVGTVGPHEISLEVPFIELDLHLINAVMTEPILDFISGKLNGSLWVEGPLGEPEFFGTLKGDYLDMTTFWTPEETFSLKNPVVTISEQLATVAASTVSAIHSGGRRSRGLIEMEAALDNWSLDYYRVAISDLSQPIALWLPLLTLNLNVETNVSGTFIIEGDVDQEILMGDIVLTDGLFSFGLPPLPSWVIEKNRTSIDMSLTTGKNVSLIYPNFDSPILRATFAENQKIELGIVAPQMSVTIGGDLAFRSGEIYYVQKNFYVTEGALKFSSILSELTGDATPTLNLRARLREFDFDGNRVDIFLILQDSPLTALEPRFESIPLKSTNEILELLGQNIVSGSDSGFSSVVALASAATDVVSRLGLIQNTTISLGFTSVIRNFLGLDVFTIRTNLLANIIYDALPGLIGDTSVTPLARYLDNTTMYIGKYLHEDLYLQGMLHFRRDPRGTGSSFLGDDLKIETEVSLEWTTPLATFSVFTQPEELSVFDLFDTMGFSVTKRFDF